MKIYVSPKIEVITIEVENGFEGSKSNDNGGISVPGWEIV